MAKPIDANTALQALRGVALAHESVEEGVACPGTAMQRHTVKTNGKAFVFLGVTDVLVKLAGGLAEAERLQAKQPDHYRVGKGGWVKVMFAADKPPPLDVMKRWIAESRLLADDAKPTAKAKVKASAKAKPAAKVKSTAKAKATAAKSRR